MIAGDHAAAAALAGAAGTALSEFRSAGDHRGTELGHRGDVLANALLLAELAHRFPDDAVLSEEVADDLTRLRRERVWIRPPRRHP